MSGRLLALGDVHGYSAALDAVLRAANIQRDDTLVTLGDYIDRGPDSRGVVQRLIDFRGQCRLVNLLGNHDQIALEMIESPERMAGWLSFGGDATLASYGCRRPADFPPSHIEFLQNCLDYYETDRFFFVHASYLENLPLAEQPREILLWDSLKRRIPGPHCSGKTAIVGHTAQADGEIVDIGYLVCIDTWVYGEGRLTLMDVNTRQTWQADKTGRLRG